MRLTLFAAAALLASSLTAHADSIFQINGILTSGSISGTVTLSADSTMFSAIDATFVNGGDTEHFTTFSNQGTYEPYDYLIQSDSGDDTLFLFLNTTSIMNYAGGSLCSATVDCSDQSSGNQSEIRLDFGFSEFVNGSLTPVMPPPAPIGVTTPEPSSIALLGTGVLGIAGVLRKRFA